MELEYKVMRRMATESGRYIQISGLAELVNQLRQTYPSLSDAAINRILGLGADDVESQRNTPHADVTFTTTMED